jgi:hypothetical protein
MIIKVPSVLLSGVVVASFVIIVVLVWAYRHTLQQALRRFREEPMKRNGLLVLSFVLVAAAGVGVYFGYPSGEETSLRLTAVALVGFGAIVVLMAALVIIYQVLGLADLKQALALPEGSVRALIAFTLVLIFVCLSAFLYNSVSSVDLSSATKVTKITKETLDALKTAFIVVEERAKDENGKDAYERKLDDKGAPIYAPKKDANGVIVNDANGVPVPDTTNPLFDTTKPLFNATYYPKHSKDANDFAKQIFTTLATIFVSVISFYFGSSTTASGIKAAARDSSDGDPKSDPQAALSAAKASAHDAQLAADRAATAAQSAAALVTQASQEKKEAAQSNANKAQEQSNSASQAAKDANVQAETARKAAADAVLAGSDVAKASAATTNAFKARDAAKTLAEKAGQNADEAERLLKQIKSDIGTS